MEQNPKRKLIIFIFLCTSNKQVESEIKNTMPFTLAALKMKYLGLKLTRYVQNLYEENYKILKKKKFLKSK